MGHPDATVPMLPPNGAALASVQQISKPVPIEPMGNVASRKTERLERRELLYNAVRECMMRAGVLSASYKFKVLSLDPRGRQYLIMMDLANKSIGDTGRLAEIEVLIAQYAKERHEILVTAVYWRTNERVTAGLTCHRSTVPSLAAEPLKHKPVVIPLTPTKVVPQYEPLQEDEVAAFKKAMALSTGASAVKERGERFRGLSDGRQDFEDTELVEPDSPTSPLGTTQYGDLN
ncbi:MAG: hypothetical protein RL211_1676 [Pseudomonadota bacterium]